jgi:hypothetical protein
LAGRALLPLPSKTKNYTLEKKAKKDIMTNIYKKGPTESQDICGIYQIGAKEN